MKLILTPLTPGHCVQPTFILLYILDNLGVSEFCLQTAIHLLIGGLVNVGQFDPEDTGCVQNMWTMGALRGGTTSFFFLRYR